MIYENTNVKDLYVSALASFSGLQEKAEAWVEAQNTEDVWVIVKKWYQHMQDNTAHFKFPDPSWNDAKHPGRRPLTQEIADKIVREMDEDFLIEKNRFPKETGLGPEFVRLPPHARVAMAQELYGVAMTKGEIKAAAQKLLDQGMREFPPKSGQSVLVSTPASLPVSASPLPSAPTSSSLRPSDAPSHHVIARESSLGPITSLSPKAKKRKAKEETRQTRQELLRRLLGRR